MRGLVALTLGVLLALGQAPAALAEPPAASQTEVGLYVVTLDGRPSSTRTVLAALGEPDVVYRYSTVLDGFAARLDDQQAALLRTLPQVVLVERSRIHRAAGDRGTPSFLGLEGRSGAWARAGGARRAGAGVVVGLVDTGIWPENPAFAGLPQTRPGRAERLPGFRGACAAGERWSPEDCNAKVVSARWFGRGFGIGSMASSESLSPRDSTGHGSHDASVAAGRRDVRVRLDQQRPGSGSGVAPGAQIAVYKACWTAPDPDDDGCTTADLVAAVDRAVADGVDVLDFSVTGSADPVDSLGLAFLGAASAGVFVAAAAGNDGPAPGTVRNTAPWVTTVGASTSTVRQGGVVLGSGRTLVGAMASDRSVPRSRVVLGAEAASPGSSLADARACRRGSLDAATVQDTVVVCSRGRSSREEKSAAVAMAGGAGMVLLNTGRDPVEADVHSVPTVHLALDDARTLHRFLRRAGGAARVALAARASEPVPVPAVAGFSGRGPVAGGLLKPDLTAPGVSVAGATAPASSDGPLWALRSGTSVSTAHVAGVAALLASVHPRWSPARLRSAMMTTAYDPDASAGPFAAGAGHVDPTAATRPGLVLDIRSEAWRRYAVGDLRARDLNVPSIALPRVVGRTSVVRRLTNVSGRTETFTASVRGARGFAVQVTPAVITLTPGDSRRVRVEVTATSAAPDGWARGHVSWTGPRHIARIPVVLRAR